MKFIDTHAHINYKYYNNSLPEIIFSAQNKGIEKIIAVGVLIYETVGVKKE